MSPPQPIRSLGLKNLIIIKPATSLKRSHEARIDELADSNKPATRRHSSRMCTIWCSGCRDGGVCQGVSAQGGVCLGSVCPGGCLPGGVSAQGVCLPRGLSARRVCAPVHAGIHPPHKQNDKRLWKHYLSVTTLRTVIIFLSCLKKAPKHLSHIFIYFSTDILNLYNCHNS